jgi:hypothetical protein
MTLLLGVLAAAAVLGHAPYESAAVKPVGGSHVGGRIVYRALPPGTRIEPRLTGVSPRATVRILLHAGTCRRHGASFAIVVAGRVLFHGSPVPISTVADGKHVFSVVVNGREAGCATIPGIN